MQGSKYLTIALLGASVVLAGCEEEMMAPSNAPPAPAASAKDRKKKEAEEEKTKDMPIVEFTEADFVESEQSRDPFRDYAHLFVEKSDREVQKQRKVKADTFALDELKLVGIITRGRSSVMLTDPNGYGWVLYTGDFVGKPELVSVGGTDGAEVAINWRVDRIRPADVVFIREDTTHPDIPPTTRVMPLYPAGEDS